MPVIVEASLVWLSFGLNQRKRSTWKRDANSVLARRDFDSCIQMSVDQTVILILRRSDLELRNVGSIKQNVDLVSSTQPLDVLVAIPRQSDRNLILAVLRKRVRNQCAASSSNRQARQVPFLRQIRRNTKRFAAWPSADSANRLSRNLFRRQDIAVQQRWREFSHRDVVESVTERVRWQEISRIDIECQQITDRILILGPRQPSKRFRPSGPGMIHRKLIECRLQLGEDGSVIVLRRSLRIHRRHLSSPQLRDNLLPRRGICTQIAGLKRSKIQSAIGFCFTVTIQAELRQHCPRPLLGAAGILQSIKRQKQEANADK